MTTSRPASPPPVIKGKHVLLGMVLFFSTVIAVNTVFVRVALRSFPGEEVKKSYYQGLNYNDILAERRRLAEIGARFTLSPLTAASPRLDVTLRDQEGRPIDGQIVSGVLTRPTNAEGRRVIVFERRVAGQYSAQFDTPLRGAWDLSLSARADLDAPVYATAKTRIVAE